MQSSDLWCLFCLFLDNLACNIGLDFFHFKLPERASCSSKQLKYRDPQACWCPKWRHIPSMLIRMTDIFFVAMGYGQFTALISRNPTFVLLNTSGKVILGTWVPNLDTQVSLPNFPDLIAMCSWLHYDCSLCGGFFVLCVSLYSFYSYFFPSCKL
jgi:hypothetical protein